MYSELWGNNYVNRKNLDKSLKRKLLKLVVSTSAPDVDLTLGAMHLIKERKSELSFETLKLIVASKIKRLVSCVVDILPDELLSAVIETFDRIDYNIIPNTKIKQFIPLLIKYSYKLDSYLKEEMLRQEHSLFYKLKDNEYFMWNILHHENCPKEILLELVNSHPKLLNITYGAYSNISKLLQEGKIKIVSVEKGERKK